MNFMRTNRRFNSCAPFALGALLCLCFSLIVQSYAPSKASSENGFSSLHKPEKESTSSPHRGSAKSIVVKAQCSIRGATRDKHSPLYPANIPPARMPGLSLNSSQAPLNNFPDIRSLIFLSPLQDRAPPCFA